MSKQLEQALRVIRSELGVTLKVRKLSAYKPDPKNMRAHSERNRSLITEAIKEVGAARSVVADAGDIIRAGNATVGVAPAAGIDEAIEIESTGKRLLVHKRGDLTDARMAKRLALMDNAAADSSDWDVENLAFEMKRDEGIITGIFDESDDILRKLRKALAAEAGGADEDFEMEPPKKPQTKRGDVWICGAHRVMCGDSVKADDVDRLTGGKVMQFAYCDPPYGISIVSAATGGKVGNQEARAPKSGPIVGKVGGDKAFGSVGAQSSRGGPNLTGPAPPKIKARLYEPVIGDGSTETAIAAFRLCAERKIKVQVWWGANHYASALPDGKCWIVWDKVNGESFLADAELAWTNVKAAVRMFRHKWNGLIKESERGERRIHPTQKPVALAVWCLEKFGKPGDNVLDLFGGSGSSLIACEGSGRAGFIMELSPPYVDLIVARWEHVTGQKGRKE